MSRSQRTGSASLQQTLLLKESKDARIIKVVKADTASAGNSAPLKNLKNGIVTFNDVGPQYGRAVKPTKDGSGLKIKKAGPSLLSISVAISTLLAFAVTAKVFFAPASNPGQLQFVTNVPGYSQLPTNVTMPINSTTPFPTNTTVPTKAHARVKNVTNVIYFQLPPQLYEAKEAGTFYIVLASAGVATFTVQLLNGSFFGVTRGKFKKSNSLLKKENKENKEEKKEKDRKK